MFSQVFGLTLFLTGALSRWDHICSLNPDLDLHPNTFFPHGVFDCPQGMECRKSSVGPKITGWGTIWGLCKKIDLERTGSGMYCSSNWECEDGFECTGSWDPHPHPRPVPGRKKRMITSRLPATPMPKCVPRLAPEGVYCNPKCSFPQRCICPGPRPHKPYPPYPKPPKRHRDRDLPHAGVCENLDPTGKYCIQEDHCSGGEKCAASGRAEFGVCKSDLDPTGKYCISTKDCKWYMLETCSDVGECVNRFSRKSPVQ